MCQNRDFHNDGKTQKKLPKIRHKNYLNFNDSGSKYSISGHKLNEFVERIINRLQIRVGSIEPDISNGKQINDKIVN